MMEHYSAREGCKLLHGENMHRNLKYYQVKSVSLSLNIVRFPAVGHSRKHKATKHINEWFQESGRRKRWLGGTRLGKWNYSVWYDSVGYIYTIRQQRKLAQCKPWTLVIKIYYCSSSFVTGVPLWWGMLIREGRGNYASHVEQRSCGIALNLLLKFIVNFKLLLNVKSLRGSAVKSTQSPCRRHN